MEITAVPRTPQMPLSQEPTKDQPVESKPQSGEQQAQQPGQDPKQQEYLNKYGKKLLDQIQKTRANWEWKRRGIIITALKNKEMNKGNQSIGFYPGTFDTFDALQEYASFTGADTSGNNGDRSMDRRPHNFYQMVRKGYIATLTPQLPKNRWLPADPDIPEDRETAKAASKVEVVIERANKLPDLLQTEAGEIFDGGAYFKHTRYVVDSDRTGTHKETVLQIMASDVIPNRYVCYNCGTTTPESELVAQKNLACPKCGSPLGPDNYFQSHVDQIPVGEEKDDIPNGMVLQDVWGVLHVDCDPDVQELKATPILNCSVEVSLGWLRTTFPQMWDVFQPGETSGTGSELLERQYRNMTTTPAGSSSWFNFSSQNKPTYSRTWCNPEFFAEMDDRSMAEELIKTFPKGVMIASVADNPLQIRACKMTEEWTWCGADKGQGLYPPPAGNPAVPIQERINDCISKIDEYMDRLACGILLANERYLDTKAMNNKAILPGVLNGVAFKANAPAGDIQNLIFQVKGEIDAAIFNYLAVLKQDMEQLVGTPPQNLGIGTMQGVETMGGQEMQRDQGNMKLNLNWQMIRREHAEAAENAVNCAARNMTDDWKNTVLDETEEFQAEYIHLDQMKGSVHAEPETDQGFPMMWSEIRNFYLDILKTGGELLDYLASEPENIDNMLQYLAVPGLIAKGAHKRARLLLIVNKLAMSQPTPGQDPMTGQSMLLPSILPIKEIDGNQATQEMLINWTEAHWDKVGANPAALDNILAFYKMCVVFERETAAEQAMVANPQSMLPPPPGAQGPPNKPPAMA